MKTILPIQSSALWRELEKAYDDGCQNGICFRLIEVHSISVYPADVHNANREWFLKHKPAGADETWYWFDGPQQRARFCRELAEELELEGL